VFKGKGGDINREKKNSKRHHSLTWAAFQQGLPTSGMYSSTGFRGNKGGMGLIQSLVLTQNRHVLRKLGRNAWGKKTGRVHGKEGTYIREIQGVGGERFDRKRDATLEDSEARVLQKRTTFKPLKDQTKSHT